MRAAILAGGKGTRMCELFPDTPKPMIPLLGKPILQWQIELLTTQGIKDITLIIGYKAEIIKSYFGSGEAFGARIDYIVEDEPLGTGGALSLLPKEDTLILLGDVYCDIDFLRFISFHTDNNADVTLFVHPNSHPHDSDIVAVDADNRVITWKSKKDNNRGELRNLVNAGLYIFNVSALPASTVIKCDLEHDVIQPILPNNKVFAYRSSEYVKDIGTPKRLVEVERDVKNGIPMARNLKNKQLAVFLDRDGTINEFDGLISSMEQIKLFPETAQAIQKLNISPYLTICVTNQPVVARGMVTIEQLDRIHYRLDTLLGREGAFLDDLLYCPHHPDKGYIEEIPEYKIDCECRKPKPGMLLEMARRYNLDLSHSYMIGDTTADIVAGQAVGCITIGLRTGEGLADGKYVCKPDMVCNDLDDAINWILGVNIK